MMTGVYENNVRVAITTHLCWTKTFVCAQKGNRLFIWNGMHFVLFSALRSSTHWSLLMYCDITQFGQHCSRPNHYLILCLFIVKLTFRVNFQWILNQNTNIWVPQNTVENIPGKMSAILSIPRCVNHCTVCILLQLIMTYTHFRAS